MAGEPWCMKPWDIARLTDFQILHLYIMPAAERAEAMRREGQGVSPEVADAEARGETYIPTKIEVVSTLMNLGFSRKQAEDEYEKQKALTDKKLGR
jgi:hypothetical protein